MPFDRTVSLSYTDMQSTSTQKLLLMTAQPAEVIYIPLSDKNQKKICPQQEAVLSSTK